MRPGRQTIRQGRTLDVPALLLEDARSAAAGWTVPSPDIHPAQAHAGAPDRTVGFAPLDEGMRAAVRNLPSRCEPAMRPPATRRLSLASALAWRRGGRLLV